MSALRVAVADDSVLLREGLVRVLRDAGLEVVAAFGDAETLLSAVPALELDAVVLEVPNPGHPYGVRGVGETPIVAPLATVANAVKNATGVRMTELPISPPRLLAALQARA